MSTEDLLQQSDEGTRISFQGLFLYTPDMPAILLTNICTVLGQVNDARRIATAIIVDPTGTNLSLDDTTLSNPLRARRVLPGR